MLAYHNKPELKQSVLAEMAMHRKADRLIQGYGYWENDKGCAVGCLIKSGNHAEYETKFGIPEMLAGLEDIIFEGLPEKESKEWPERFLKAIHTGSDLSRVGYQFMYWNLTKNLVLQDSDDAEVQAVIVQVRATIKQCADAICPLTKGEKLDKSIALATQSVQSAAESAAESAARSARSARSAQLAAESAARSALSAARSARSAQLAAESARSAQSAAESARLAAQLAARLAAWSARSAARLAAWSAQSAAQSAAESEAWSAGISTTSSFSPLSSW